MSGAPIVCGSGVSSGASCPARGQGGQEESVATAGPGDRRGKQAGARVTSRRRFPSPDPLPCGWGGDLVGPFFTEAGTRPSVDLLTVPESFTLFPSHEKGWAVSVQAILGLGSHGLVLILCWFSNSSLPLLSKVLCHRVKPQIHRAMWDSPYPPHFLCSLLTGPRPVALGAGDKVPVVPT